MEQVPSRLSFLNLQGPFPVRQAECNMIRSTPRMQRNVSDLYSMKVQSGNVRSKSNTLAQHLHLDEVKRTDTSKLREMARASLYDLSATKIGDGPLYINIR